MKVVHIISGLGAGGAEQMLERLILSDLWKPEGTEHSVISLTTLGPVGARMRAAGVSVTTLEAFGLSGALRALFQLRAAIKKLRPDVVQTWMYHADLLGGLAAKLACHRKIIWNLRMAAISEANVGAPTALVRWTCAVLSRWIPDLIIAASREVRDSHEALGYERGRMIIIGNGFVLPNVDGLETVRPAMREAWGVADNELIIGVVARFHPLKGHEVFIDAAAKVICDEPRTRFAFIGLNMNDKNEAVRAWIAAQGLQDRFLLLGQRTDVPDCLAALDIVCLPSLSEGFPNALGEAMAAGKACLATDVGGAVELLGECEWIVPKGDPDALAAGLVRLARLDPAARAAIGRTARARIAKEYSLDVCVSHYLRLYRDGAYRPLQMGGN